MRTTLLAGASALALVATFGSEAAAQTASDNTLALIWQENDGNNVMWGDGTTAQENSQAATAVGPVIQAGDDVVTFNLNSVDDGALVTGSGNALGQDARDNAVADGSSTATRVYAPGADALAINDSTAVDDGAFVGGNGVAFGLDAEHNAGVGGNGLAVATDGGSLADDGSSFQYGSGNTAATAEDDGAAVVGSGLAIATDGESLADQGSSFQYGDGNVAATAEDDGAAVVGSGLALATDGGDLADEGSNFVYGDGNISAAGDDGSAVVGQDGFAMAVDGEIEIEDNATGVFGLNNAVSVAHLAQTVSDVSIDISSDAEGEATSTLTTGSIYSNNLTRMSGVNDFFANTGFGNQGTSVSIAARASFNGN